MPRKPSFCTASVTGVAAPRSISHVRRFSSIPYTRSTRAGRSAGATTASRRAPSSSTAGTSTGEAAANWQRSAFYHLLTTGADEVRRRIGLGDPADFLLSRICAATPEPERSRFVSVGRYALRGVGRAQELFTLDPSPS